MRSLVVILSNLIMAVAVGCGSYAAPDEPDLKERAVGLAKEIRNVMDQPSFMQLDEGRMADSGLRGIRQREVAKPFMPKLIECGKAAGRAPLGTHQRRQREYKPLMCYSRRSDPNDRWFQTD